MKQNVLVRICEAINFLAINAGVIITLCPTEIIAQPWLLFTLYSTSIRGINMDGSHKRHLYTGGRPFAIDFDYRYDNEFISLYEMCA